MYCYKCGQPTVGDNIQCDDCRHITKCEDCGREECICDEDDRFEDDNECEECCMKYGNHHYLCPHDFSPFGEFIRNGYD